MTRDWWLGKIPVTSHESTSHPMYFLPPAGSARESRYRTSDICRPFRPFLSSSSPWIKYKEDHKVSSKDSALERSLISLSDKYYRKKYHWLHGFMKKFSIETVFSMFPSSHRIGKGEPFYTFCKKLLPFYDTTKKHGHHVSHNDDPHESAAALFIHPEEHTSSRLGRHRLNIRNWSVIRLPYFFM